VSCYSSSRIIIVKPDILVDFQAIYRYNTNAHPACHQNLTVLSFDIHQLGTELTPLIIKASTLFTDANHQSWDSVIPKVRLKSIPDITPNLSVRYTCKYFVVILEFGDALSRAFQEPWPLNLYVEKFRC